MEYDTLSIPILFVGCYREKKCAKFIEKSVMTENTPFITVFFALSVNYMAFLHQKLQNIAC